MACFYKQVTQSSAELMSVCHLRKSGNQERMQAVQSLIRRHRKLRMTSAVGLHCFIEILSKIVYINMLVKQTNKQTAVQVRPTGKAGDDHQTGMG